MEIVKVKDLIKKFGDFKAVDGISFSVNKGEIFGIIGPNGAGKTTTLRMLLNLTKPTSGDIILFGEKSVEKVKDKISYLPEERGLYETMNAEEFVRFFTELYGRKFDRAYFESMLNRLELPDSDKGRRKKQKIGTFSKGMKQKISLLRALAVNPELLILDEPVEGIDPRSTIIVREMIKEQAKTRTVILSTHIMPYAEKICDRVCILNKGKIVALGTVAELKRLVSKEEIYSFSFDSMQKLIGIDKYVEKYTIDENRLRVVLGKGKTLSQIIKFLVERKFEILSFEKIEPTLEDVFMKVTS